MRHIARIAPLLIPLALLAGCASAPALAGQIEEGVAAAGETFSLADVASVDGTSFLVLCPYDSADSVTERLGFIWSGAPDLTQDDRRQAIAVVDEGAVTSSAQLSRDTVDFCGEGPWQLLPVDSPLTVTSDDGVKQVSAP